MRFRKVFLAAVLMLACAGTASAGKLWIGPIGGLTLPFGDFGDVSNMGFHLGVTGDCELAGGFSLGGDIAWSRSTGKDEYEKLLSSSPPVGYGVPTDVTFDIWPITVHGKYTLPGAGIYHPFMKAGLGLYHIGSKIDAGSAGSKSDSQNKFGVNVGGGTSLWSAGVLQVGAEAALHVISTEGSSTTLITLSGTARFGGAGK